MNQTNGSEPGDQADDTTEPAGQPDIAEFLKIARGESEAIRQLTGCVTQLCRVQAAKEALLQLSPAELRVALIHQLPTGLQLVEPR